MSKKSEKPANKKISNPPETKHSPSRVAIASMAAIIVNSIILVPLIVHAVRVLPRYEEFLKELVVNPPIMPYFLTYGGLLCAGVGLALGIWSFVFNKKGKNCQKTSAAALLLGALSTTFYVIVLAMLLSTIYSTVDGVVQ